MIGGVILLGLVAFSLVGCYAYYPPPEEVLQQLRILNTDVVSGAIRGDRKLAEYQLPLMEDWTRRLQVGLYLRTGRVSDYQQVKARVFLNKLELLEHALDDDSDAEVRICAKDVERAGHRLHAAFADHSHRTAALSSSAAMP